MGNRKKRKKPVKYDPAMCEKAYNFIVLNDGECTKKSVADCLGIRPDVFFKWLNQRPEFAEAVDSGFMKEKLSPAIRDSGRRRYNPRTHPERAYQLCKKYHPTLEDLAIMLDVSKSAVATWKKDHPEFAEAIVQGCDEYAGEGIRRAMVKSAMGHTIQEKELRPGEDGEYDEVKVVEKEVPPNFNAGRFLLQTIHPEKYQDKQKTDHSVVIKLETAIPEPDALPENIIDVEPAEDNVAGTE